MYKLFSNFSTAQLPSRDVSVSAASDWFMTSQTTEAKPSSVSQVALLTEPVATSLPNHYFFVAFKRRHTDVIEASARSCRHGAALMTSRILTMWRHRCWWHVCIHQLDRSSSISRASATRQTLHCYSVNTATFTLLMTPCKGCVADQTLLGLQLHTCVIAGTTIDPQIPDTLSPSFVSTFSHWQLSWQETRPCVYVKPISLLTKHI